LTVGWSNESLTVGFKGDARYDAVFEELDGEIRDLTLAFSPTSKTDLKVGRQVLTWGTGDLLFLNDLFPKDWEAFFAGRDTEYLKAPSNAVRSTWYGDLLNIDLAWTPVFEPDNFLTGERFSFFSPLAGGSVAPQPPLSAIEPEKNFENGELAVRLFKTVRGSEYAAYAYYGFFHQPTALTLTLQPTFAPLSAFGASFRRPLMSGIFNTEVVYYASRDDRPCRAKRSAPTAPRLRTGGCYQPDRRISILPRVDTGLWCTDRKLPFTSVRAGRVPAGRH
jgi:hypothetical protein